VSAFDLQPGDCYNTESLPPPDGSAEPIRTVDAVPCTEPHTDQVVAKIGYQASDDWVDVRDNRIDVDCAAEFDRRVEKKILDDETYLATYLFPVDHDTWKWRPAAVCVVSTEQPTTGSVLKS
jgi:hypothetical protein